MNKNKNSEVIYQLKVVLKNSKPLIWRRFLIPSDFSLLHLHTVIQRTMGWLDGHLHSFDFGRTIYQIPDEDFPGNHSEKDERKFSIGSLRLTIGSKLMYWYDFGDNWMHDVIVEKIMTRNEVVSPVPICLKAANNCPPEDCGGIRGYYEKLAILQNPNHPNHQEIKEWMPDQFDPSFVDLEEINDLLKIFQSKKMSTKDVQRLSLIDYD